MAASSQKVWLLATALALLLASAVQVSAQATSAVFQCQVTESSILNDVRGQERKDNFRSHEEILRFGAGRFQIFDAKTKAWGPNMCLPSSPETERETQCVFAAARMFADFPTYSSEEIGGEQGRKARVSFAERNVYEVTPGPDGMPNLRLQKVRKTQQVTYFTVDDKSIRDFSPDPYRRNENWAGYNLQINGRGSCKRVQ